MNEAFSVAHPNLLQFIDVIRSKSNSYIERIERIKLGYEQPPHHITTIVIPRIPSDYISFQP